ncbi:C40 family peptidase [Azomonas macrocytogenes]|uniref:Cell wall-associated NlpC family hydrolase n=1 Tax=Azomonas macrocytogenes TaxID=69962 RepID=A0A839T6C0_AZOMA|nr:C40 family peptidase [Azomonas macrocytogenes]MBB3104972.1 cell wall-associated NlpC family hydrolase [Azomonas macrocytogenes]
MLRRLAPLTTCAAAILLTACAGQVPEQQASNSSKDLARHLYEQHAMQEEEQEPAEETAQVQAETILERGLKLLGTPYRFGGVSLKTGFDCSGFIGFLFREEAGIQLPRSTREMIALDVPQVSRDKLQAGDILFFNKRGRGRVSHVGIYIGDDRFLHSASRRSGGVRVDSLGNTYWRASYMQAKRVLTDTTSASGGA